jgi:oxygen-independent coproporphyrinogen-3 oxidase
MSGIYIHVPFCKKKCEYCDFYSVTSLEAADKFAETIEKEIELRSKYLEESKVETIYFGGGTPSLLSESDLEHILSNIQKRFNLSENIEVTIEANPDDLSPAKLRNFRKVGFNRISMGVQSFADSDLLYLGRRHNSQQAIETVEQAHKSGFENISIDLIYGLPSSSNRIWEENLRMAFSLPVKHLSCYHLIYEEGTPLTRKVDRGLVLPVDEETSVKQFEILQQKAGENGFIHYEISNLAKEGFCSKHNVSYWQQVPYLGLGPSAHSYNGFSREWNPSSLNSWFESIGNREIATEKEILTETEKYNEYLITSLRTIWGLNLKQLIKQFGPMRVEELLKISKKYIENGFLLQSNNTLAIPPKHFLISDGIIADLQVV